MEYPLPSTFTGTPVTQLAFLSIPEMVLAFDVQGDNTMTGAWAERFLDEYIAESNREFNRDFSGNDFSGNDFPARTTLFNPESLSIPAPAIITVQNTSRSAEKLVLFNPHKNLLAINFNNNAAVLIQNPAEYAKILTQLGSGSVFGLIRITLNRDLPNCDASKLPIIKMIKQLPTGGTSTNIFNPQYGISAFALDNTTIEFSAIIDSFTELEMIVPAGQQVELTAFYSQQRRFS